MTRHRWSAPQRFESKTERSCTLCGLIKVTRHVDDGGRDRGVRDREGRLVWIEWWKPVARGADGRSPDRDSDDDGMPERLDCPGDRTPACEPKSTETSTAKEAA
jgi:hypothetical protein